MLDLEQSLLLVYTGVARFSSEIAEHQVNNIARKASELQKMREMVDQAVEVLVSNEDISDFGRLLHESWMLKSRLSERVSTQLVDDIYAKARAHGAIGGKLLGAGGGGFILLYVECEKREAVSRALSDYLQVPFRFENLGSQVIYFLNQPKN